VRKTLEIPDSVHRRAKVKAAELGIPLSRFVTEAIEQKLASYVIPGEKPWMRGFGKLRHLHEENKRIDRIIEEEFGQIEPAPGEPV